MKRFFIITLLAASVAIAQAQSVLFTVDMDGNQEVPPVTTAGYGSGTLTLDTITGAIDYSITYTNLTGLSSLMHIHAGAAGVNGSPFYNFDGAGFTPGAFSGDVVGSGFVDVSRIASILAGDTYVNVHSTFAGGGEIRGQLLRVPEPGTLALMGLAGAGLIIFRRRH